MNSSNDQKGAADTTDFGYQQVPTAEKAARVRAVFESVAGNYDLMNDLMSGGAHRIWKRFTLSQTGLRPGQRALDVAGGTGDLDWWNRLVDDAWRNRLGAADAPVRRRVA